ncbi:MepB family protein [Leptospira weilii]|uniref:MepB protein n=3 Tax=Leptospira weilii TaxID=28184 RepID=N1U2F3_9LEPT|nr:MepB family protein [Leptospira weilii]EMM74905.1 MepB protein [Leptospira weilii str. 2006001855]EMY12316.1 MepB protein [Leptospira weilii str. Ecochallenge]EMN46644.1 MepB protein [Leptospira weilii str. LNT 1234]EMN90740.1 MepB protein [Leptospira weilii str. UI 13098]MCL8265957.1 MepB family protein [Leptospira weilii]
MKNKIQNIAALPAILQDIKDYVFDLCNIRIVNLQMENESSEYGASAFDIGNLKITFRLAKITPTKIGQFVTLWKRNSKGHIQPFDVHDLTDYVIIGVKDKNLSGQFIFPKQILCDRGIISDKKREGKRGFRVYPLWDFPTNKQAQRTQKWQLDYFFENSKAKPVDIVRVRNLLNIRN